jgi:CheY-like chemotaxis protein
MAIRILIADDNVPVRRALRQTLESRGHWEIIEAQNGEDAVIQAREAKPDLVILDLAMPVMDGMRAARVISHRFPSVPIILHTLHWSPRVEVEALKAGVRKVVAKADSATILTAVEEMFGPALLGYTATVTEPSASVANITVIRPASRLAEANIAENQAKSGDQLRRGASGPADQ